MAGHGEEEPRSAQVEGWSLAGWDSTRVSWKTGWLGKGPTGSPGRVFQHAGWLCLQQNPQKLL